MNKIHHASLRLMSLLVLVSAVSGCQKETDRYLHAPGTPIIFGASTEWENGLSTRTEYSGKDEEGRPVGSYSDYERIDWVADYDCVRIYSPQVSEGHELSGKADDYSLTGTVTANHEVSSAGIAPANGNGLHWGTGDHYFFALYPAPGTRSNYAFTNNNPAGSAQIAAGTGNQATVTGTIPATQEVILSGTEYKPNMNYAYMYAAKMVSASSTGAVSLPFNPLVTAFAFTFKQFTSDPVSEKLTKIELSGPSGSRLTGSFQATLSVDGSGKPVVSPATTGTPGNKITVTLPNGGVTLSDTPVKVTLLALPFEQKNLTLTLYFGANFSTRRSLELKDATLVTADNPEGWVAVPARKKIYINNVAAPGNLWTYTLDVSGNYTSSFAVGGGSLSYTVTSYRTGSSSAAPKQPASWKTYYSEDDGENWVEGAPNWLSGFSSSGPGSTPNPTSYSATVTANNSPMIWEGSSSSVSDNKNTARDLSCYDIYGNKTGGTEGSAPYNTANCYVVSAPGWYRIPCVYGNAIKNGSTNTSAYTASGTGSGILTGNFLNHADVPITRPWIKDNSITINDAVLVWQDVNGMISQVEYDSSSSYIYFKVTNPFQGNALIAARANGVIVWSWHIWMMDHPDDNLRPKKMYAHSGSPDSALSEVTILPIDLGFCNSVPGKAHARHVHLKFVQPDSGQEKTVIVSQRGDVSYSCTYYQWGRKDPMVPGVLMAGASAPGDKTLYTVSGSTITRPANVSSPASIGTSIKNPAAVLVASNQGDWCDHTYANLWNSQVTSLQNKRDYTVPGEGRTVQIPYDVPVTKTIYDPCPPGFKMPNAFAFTGFTATGVNYPSYFTGTEIDAVLTYEAVGVEDFDAFDTLLGFNYYLDRTDPSKGTVFFERTGSRNYESGNIDGVGTWSDHTTAQATAGGWHVYFTYGRAGTTPPYKGYVAPLMFAGNNWSMPVRPIGE